MASEIARAAPGNHRLSRDTFSHLACLWDMALRLLIRSAWCAAAATIPLATFAAAPPPPLLVVPDTAQQRVQAEAMIQQAQSQARIAADQAKVQAQLDANQARLEGQVAAQEAGTQAQLETQQRIAAMAPALQPPVALAGPIGQPSEPPFESSLRGPAGTMQLITLTPRLGSYFGTDHGVLVARAPAHGVLKLQDGDVILSIGGRAPASGSQAIRILTSYDPGERIELVILRDHHRLDVTTRMPSQPAGP
jgi:hypothetical protein